MASEKEQSSMREDDEPGMSMVDVLEEQTALEEDAIAVLGAADAHNCTYDQGYVKRQALYACETCSKYAGDKCLGSGSICLACSLECHEGHRLYELYTKRNFRCDCGNSRFKEGNCKLRPKKPSCNPDNKYNQNFRGLYCTCSRPYPDPEHESDDEMIQCVVCEDWYHTSHLGTPVPDTEYDDMICDTCMGSNDFLWAYDFISSSEDSLVEVVDDKINDAKSDEGPTENKETDSNKSERPSGNAETDSKSNEVPSGSDDPPATDTKSQESSVDSNTKGSSNGDSKNSVTGPCDEVTSAETSKTDAEVLAADSRECCLKQWQQENPGKVGNRKGATFWKKGWRLKLCTCKDCWAMYTKLEVEFLTATEDTISSYEASCKTKPKNQYEQGMEVLSNMDRTMQVEMLHGFNDMKTELKDYLKKFADNGKVVRAEDIQEFFSQMSSRKKQRVGGVQHFCK